MKLPRSVSKWLLSGFCCLVTLAAAQAAVELVTEEVQSAFELPESLQPIERGDSVTLLTAVRTLDLSPVKGSELESIDDNVDLKSQILEREVAEQPLNPIQRDELSNPTPVILFEKSVSGEANDNLDWVFALADTGSEMGKFWIGLLCEDAGDALREHLGLDPKVGLLVEAVTDDAPAKKAGLQKNDVLVSWTIATDDSKAEPKPLQNVLELVEAVQKAETKPLRLILIRKGQKQTIEVTPAERPQVPVTVQIQRFGPAEQQLQTVLQAWRNTKTQAGKEADHSHEALKSDEEKLRDQYLSLRLAGPMFVPAPPAPKLPEGMSLEFRQVVGQPERMVVSKGDQKWEIAADDLQKLPEDVRNVVSEQLAFRHRKAMAFAIPHSVKTSQTGGTVLERPVTTAKSATALPDGLSVTIVRKGSEPMQINVKRGDQSWEITEKDLGKLPEDVRIQVAPMLTPRPATANTIRSWATKTPITIPATPFDLRHIEQQAREATEAVRHQRETLPKAGSTDATRQLNERQEAILKQLQQLTEKVEKLQQAIEKPPAKQ